MNEKEFRSLVLQMREAQTMFFKSDPNSSVRREALRLSKKLEQMVDKDLQTFFDDGPTMKQAKLF